MQRPRSEYEMAVPLNQHSLESLEAIPIQEHEVCVDDSLLFSYILDYLCLYSAKFYPLSIISFGFFSPRYYFFSFVCLDDNFITFA